MRVYAFQASTSPAPRHNMEVYEAPERFDCRSKREQLSRLNRTDVENSKYFSYCLHNKAMVTTSPCRRSQPV